MGLMVMIGLVVGAPKASDANGFIADLSHHLIAITTAFSGTEVLLFGAVDSRDANVVVVVRGPEQFTGVRRKNRFGIVWLNSEEVEFGDVPSYYAIATNQPLDEIADEAELRRYQIGTENIRLVPTNSADLDHEDLEEFRLALLRNKARAGLYVPSAAPVKMVDDRLFRTTLRFPANVSPGSYQVQVYQFEEGAVIAAQTSILIVSKVGIEADIYDIGRNRPALYGLISIVLAVAAGWTAGVVFKK